MLKKTLAVSAAALMIFGLTACGEKAEEPTQDVVAVEEETVEEEVVEEAPVVAVAQDRIAPFPCDATTPTVELLEVPGFPGEGVVEMVSDDAMSCDETAAMLPEGHARHATLSKNVNMLDQAAYEAWVAESFTVENGWSVDENGSLVINYTDGSRILFNGNPSDYTFNGEKVADFALGYIYFPPAA